MDSNEPAIEYCSSVLPQCLEYYTLGSYAPSSGISSEGRLEYYTLGSNYNSRLKFLLKTIHDHECAHRVFGITRCARAPYVVAGTCIRAPRTVSDMCILAPCVMPETFPEHLAWAWAPLVVVDLCARAPRGSILYLLPLRVSVDTFFSFVFLYCLVSLLGGRTHTRSNASGIM